MTFKLNHRWLPKFQKNILYLKNNVHHLVNKFMVHQFMLDCQLTNMLFEELHKLALNICVRDLHCLHANWKIVPKLIHKQIATCYISMLSGLQNLFM